MPPTHWLRGRMDPSHTCGVLQRHRTIHKHGSRRTSGFDTNDLNDLKDSSFRQATHPDGSIPLARTTPRRRSESRCDTPEKRPTQEAWQTDTRREKDSTHDGERISLAGVWAAFLHLTSPPRSFFAGRRRAPSRSCSPAPHRRCLHRRWSRRSDRRHPPRRRRLAEEHHMEEGRRHLRLHQQVLQTVPFACVSTAFPLHFHCLSLLRRCFSLVPQLSFKQGRCLLVRWLRRQQKQHVHHHHHHHRHRHLGKEAKEVAGRKQSQACSHPRRSLRSHWTRSQCRRRRQRRWRWWSREMQRRQRRWRSRSPRPRLRPLGGLLKTRTAGCRLRSSCSCTVSWSNRRVGTGLSRPKFSLSKAPVANRRRQRRIWRSVLG